MLALHTLVARSAAEMEAIGPLWNRILSTRGSHLFQSFAWNQLAAKTFSDRLTPLVVAVEADDGAAIIPATLNRASGQIELLGEALFDYRDVLHLGNPEVLRLAWQRIAQMEKPLSVTALQPEAAHNNWRSFPLTPFACAPEVRRDLITETQFRSAHRRVERSLRRFQERGASFRVSTGEDSALARYLYACKCEQFANDENNLFRDPVRRRFIVDVASIEGKDCEIFTLQSEDEILIAGLVTFRDGNCRRFYTIYFDPVWAAYSPGILLVYEVTARSLGEGLDCDYMTGEYPYKVRFANSSRLLYKVDVTATQLAEIARNPVISSAA